MGKRLYVGNLSWGMDDNSLATTFAEAGTVTSAKVITDRETGRSRGFGFVEMDTDDQAAKAVELLHDREIDGRKINVNEARPQQDRDDRGGRGGGHGGRGGGGGRY